MRIPSKLFATCLVTVCLGIAGMAPAVQAAAPAWAPIAGSGPTNLAPVQSEVQRLAVDAEEGDYTLTAFHPVGKVTAFLNATTTSLGSCQLESGSIEVGDGITGPFVPVGTTIVEIQGGTEECAEGKGFERVILSQPTTNSKAQGINVPFIVYDASATTSPVPSGAEAPEVDAALDAALATLPGGGSVTVEGGPGDKGASSPYFLHFGGSLEDTDVVALGVDDSGLNGGFTATAKLRTVVEGGPGTSTVAIYAQNVGGLPSTGTTTLELTLPEGIEPTGVPDGGTYQKEIAPGVFLPAANWACAETASAPAVKFTCTSERSIGPGFTLPPIKAPISSSPGAEDGVVHIEVAGGGATGTGTYDMPLIVSAIPAPPGVQSFNAAPYTDEGAVDKRAGAHPYSASTGILVNTVRSAKTGEVVPAGEFRDIVVDTPPGFFGNPISTEQCPESTPQRDCKTESIVATAQIPLERFGDVVAEGKATVQNIEAPFGYPAKFRFQTGAETVTVNVVAGLRSDEDYGLEIGSYNTPQVKVVFGAFFTIWGTPADPGHDAQRCIRHEPADQPPTLCGPGGANTAFLTNPVDCAEEALRQPAATLNVNTWQNPGLLFSQAVPLDPVTGCDELDFEVDEFVFEPGTDDADSPASFTTELELPNEGLLDPDKRMNPTIKQTVLDLPDGIVLNASAADGLEACSFGQIGYKGNDFDRPNEIRFDKKPNSCPNASRIGTGELNSSLIAEPMEADLYLAEQGGGNPFGSLFAIYLVIENPRNGVFIKLPGEVQVNESTGKQKIVLRDLPPLPFDSLKLKLKGGDRSPLATPTTCGDYTTIATNTPWSAPESGPPLKSPSEFEIDDGPAGGCADSESERPFVPGLRAGADLVQAGAHTPLRFQVTRQDGHQELNTLRFDLPQGLAAKLKGVPLCPEPLIAQAISRDSGEAEQDNPSCPAVSQVGRTLAGAGSGDRPFYAPGKLYLAGPYKGHPLSVVAITPAVAGPFDLGNVVIRNAIAVNPITAQVSAISDEIPKVHEGIPLRVKDIRVILDRPGFALNPTSCEQKLLGAQIAGSHGALSTLASRFQVGNCAALGFEPRTRLQLFGGVKRGKYQGVRAVVRPRPGDANISRTVVRFPKSAFVAQENIRTVCTRVQYAADACPKGSIYGRAIAWSPLLDEPLKGNVYLRSSDNTLPDAVADLRGPAHQPIKVEVAVRNDAVNGALRNTVQAVPDAPVSYFRLQMFGGKKGLIVNSRNICRGKNQAAVGMRAHNGRRSTERVDVFNKRCKALKRKQRAKRRKANRSAQRRAVRRDSASRHSTR